MQDERTAVVVSFVISNPDLPGPALKSWNPSGPGILQLKVWAAIKVTFLNPDLSNVTFVTQLSKCGQDLSKAQGLFDQQT